MTAAARASIDAIRIPQAGPGRRGSLRPLDLTGRERHLRGAMQAMARIASRFARAARRTLPFLVRRRANLEPGSVALAGPGPDRAAEAGPRFVVRLEAEDGPAWGMVSLNSEALSLLLESALGGGEGGAVAALASELSLAQAALAARIARSLARDFAAVVKEETGLRLQVVAAQSLASGEEGDASAVDGLAVECSFAGLSDSATVSVAVSAEALEAAARDQAEEDAPAASDPRMAEAVHDVPVAIVAELGVVTLDLRQVLSFKVGQVIRLPTAVDDSVVVRVAGLKKFIGTPVVSRGQLSVQIRGRHEE
jgi:flagellar motor switch protein FliM